MLAAPGAVHPARRSDLLPVGQSGRFYVALSLEEAEALRGIIHIALNPLQPETWLPGSSASLALRSLGSRGAVLDKTPGFSPGGQYQVKCCACLDGLLRHGFSHLWGRDGAGDDGPAVLEVPRLGYSLQGLST